MACVVFDLDGTLADTSGDLIAAANHCFAALGAGHVLNPKADAPIAFHGARALLRTGLERVHRPADEALIDQQYRRLLEYYGANIDRHTVLYPGVKDALDRLAGRGDALGVCTNKPEGLAQDLLLRLGIRDRFAALLGADTLPVRKPDPEHLWQTIDRCGGDRTNAVMIGDTGTDRATARNAGLPCILVAFGPAGDGARALNPHALLPHYDRIEQVLAQVLQAAP